MNIEFWGDFGNGKIEKTQEFVNISRVPQINDLFEFVFGKNKHLVKVTSLRFGYKEGDFSHTEFCKAIVKKLEEDIGLTCAKGTCENHAEPSSIYCKDHQGKAKDKLCSKSDCDRPRLVSSIYCKEHLELSIVGASYEIQPEFY